MKMSKKTHNMVVLSELSSLFCEDFDICVMLCRACNLMMIHAKWIRNPLTHGTKTIKTFTKSTKNTTANKLVTQKKNNTRSSVECWDHCDKTNSISLIESTQHQLIISCQSLHIFCWKIETVEKIMWLFASGCD